LIPNLKFNKKYNPLFLILNENNKQLKKVDTVLISGGRDSGKTFSLGCFVAIAAAQYNHRILYTRQTMSSTSNSITSALENRMTLLNLEPFYTYANNNFHSKVNKGKITITGQKTSVGTQTANLKSIEDYSIFITDEGEELTSFEDWVKIKRGIRAKDKQCLSIISFNPPTKQHWIYKEFYHSVPEGFNGILDNILYIHTTYLDNGKENMAEHNWNDYMRLKQLHDLYLSTPVLERISLERKIQKAYRDYKSIVLGGFRDSAEGVIFSYQIGDFIDSEYSSVYGMDHGFTHPTAVVKINVDKDQKKIYLKEIFYKTNQTTSQIVEAIKPIVNYDRVWCDSAVPMFIKDLYNSNINIRACKKPKIYDSINQMLDYELIVDKDSTNLINELDNYRWSERGNDEPIDDFNHAIDAVRYAVSHVLTVGVSQVL